MFFLFFLFFSDESLENNFFQQTVCLLLGFFFIQSARGRNWEKKRVGGKSELVKEPFRQSHKNQKRSIAWDIRSLPMKEGRVWEEKGWMKHTQTSLFSLKIDFFLILQHLNSLPLRKTLDEIIKNERIKQCIHFSALHTRLSSRLA